MLDVRALFPVERREMLELLGSLSSVDWSRETVCQGLYPVIDTFMRALPHALGWCDYPEGTAVLFVVPGDAGGQLTAGSRWVRPDVGGGYQRSPTRQSQIRGEDSENRSMEPAAGSTKIRSLGS